MTTAATEIIVNVRYFVFYSPTKNKLVIIGSGLFRFGVDATWWDPDFGDLICIGDFD